MGTLLTNNQISDTDVISQSLDLAPLKIEPKKEDVEHLGDDYEFARGNLISIISKGHEALDGILDVAGMSQHPRSYEVVSTLINSLTAANKDLLELTKRKKELDGSNINPTTINNNLFVGSTAELQKLIKNNESKE